MRHHYLNRILAAGALLLLVVPQMAQVFFPARRISPSVPSSEYNPTNWLPTPEYWWNASDLSSSPVETWADRVKGRNLKQTTTGLKPLWSTNGVFFDGADDYLLVTNVLETDLPSGADLGSWLFVIGQQYPTRPVPQLIFGDSTSGSSFVLFGNTNWLGDSQGPPATDFGPVGTNYYTVLLQSSNLNTTSYAYFNNGHVFGPANWNSGAAPTRLGNSSGNDPSGNPWPLYGFVQEVIGWTNYAFTATQLSNINKYATSTWAIGTPPPYIATTAVFDGSSDFTRLTSAAPPGLADSKQITVSVWVRFDGGDGVTQVIFSAGPSPNNSFLLLKSTSNRIEFYGRNSVPADVLYLKGSTALTASSTWHHIYACADMDDAAKRKIYVDGVAETLTVTTYTIGATIDLVGAGFVYTFGDDTSNTLKLNGALSTPWFNDSYLDDVSKFYSGGVPVWPGFSGELPTGGSPVFFFLSGGSFFRFNTGSGGNFTITGSIGTTTPPWAP